LAPIEEGGTKPARRAKSETRLSIAVMDYFNAKASSGQVVGFGQIFEAMQGSARIPSGAYQTVRKPLQRSLKELVDSGLIKGVEVPRGYRIVPNPPE
jgi:hypothetical protein